MIPDIIRQQARSAITGRWVSRLTADRNPATTVIEIVRYPPPSRRVRARAKAGGRTRAKTRGKKKV